MLTTDNYIPHVSSGSHGLRSHLFLTCYRLIDRYAGFPLEAIINEESLRPRATLPSFFKVEFLNGLLHSFHPALVIYIRIACQGKICYRQLTIHMSIQVPPTIQVQFPCLLWTTNYLHVGSSSPAMQFKFTNEDQWYIYRLFSTLGSASCGPKVFETPLLTRRSAGAALSSNLRRFFMSIMN